MTIKALQGDEEGAIENVGGGHSGDLCVFLTILDNILAICDSAGGEEWTSEPHPHPGSLPEGAGGGVKKDTAAYFAKALWR